MSRIPVLSSERKPLMPTKPSRARRWIKGGKAVGKFNDLGQFYVQLKVEPSDQRTQTISVGIDPRKLYSGIGVQSGKFTLWTGHLDLPFKKVRKRMDDRRMMRRGRRGRRINRQLHLMILPKGDVRRKYGGTTTEFGLRKGDLVNSSKEIGYVSGQTKKQISVSDANWKRLGQIAKSKVTLIRRSNGLIVTC